MIDTQRRLEQALEELGNEVIKHFREVMDSDMGINPKTGTNTLKDSNLYKQMDMKVYPDREMVEVLINSYAEYVDMGRMSHAEVKTGNFTPMKNGGFPPLNVLRVWAQRKGILKDNRTLYPLNALRDWTQRKGIPADNRTLYLIGRSIAINGIRPRPVFSYAWRDLEDMLPEYLDKLFEAIINDLVEWFNK